MRAVRRSSPYTLVLVALLASACSNEPIEKLWQYPSLAASYSSPAVGNNMIVFGTEGGELHALSRDGAFLWKFQTRKEIVSAPQIMDNLIFFGSTNHNFYAVDLKGRQVWKYTTFSRIKGDGAVDPETSSVYFGSYDRHLYSLDAVTRAERWVFPPHEDGRPQDPDAETPEEPAAEPLAEAGEASDEAKEGEEGEEEPAPPKVDKSKWPRDAFSYAQPTVTSTGLLVVGNLDGHLYAVDKRTGELRWRWGEEGAKDRRGITSTVLEHDGALYFGANDGKVHAIQLSDQSSLWTFETGGEVNSSPIIDGSGTLYVGSRDHKLYALDAKTGQKKWEVETQGPILAKPVLYQDKLIIFGSGEGDGHVYAVSTSDGKVFWKFKTGDKVEADAYVDGDRFYVPSGDKNLYAFRVKKLP